VETGRKADLVLLDMRTVNFTPLNDVRNHLVYCENGASVEKVMVNGQIVVDDGRCTLVDEDALLAEIRGFAPDLLARHAEVERLNAAFTPHFEAIYRRCNGQSLGINRYAGHESDWLTTATS
jgi:hypothetical protein